MHYRRLGRSGLKISEISLGAWITFGNQISETTASDLIHQLGKLRDAFAHDLQPLRAQSIQLDADFFSTSIQGARCIA